MQYQDMSHPPQQHKQLVAEFTDFITDRAFPCVGAKSASNRGRMDMIVCDQMGTDESAQQLCSGLAQFSARYPEPGEDPVSFVAIFQADAGGEDEFHEKLWRQLQLVHDLDATRFSWARGVSDDPASNDFSFSVAGRAFFVVGLHPRSSRLARRPPRPTLVFNFHEQFEAMKASGRYAKLQSAIRQRDMELQGYINPVLAQFGAASEAQQYSGKHGGGCPFHARKAAA
jgi:FPC/CPF motif-containing protein YcgG